MRLCSSLSCVCANGLCQCLHAVIHIGTCKGMPCLLIASKAIIWLRCLPISYENYGFNFPYLQICLARACGGAYVTALCLLTALGVAFFSILRTKADPGSGILSILGYLISVLTGEFTWPARVMWRQVHLTFLCMLLAIAPES